MIKSGWMKFLGILMVLFAVVAVPAWAGTDTYDANTGVANEVGGLPVCVTFSGTDGGTGAMTVTLPTGFLAKFAYWFDNATDGDAPKFWMWVKGMTTGTGSLQGGSTAFSLDATADTDASTAGSFVIDDDCITDDHAYYGVICR